MRLLKVLVRQFFDGTAEQGGGSSESLQSLSKLPKNIAIVKLVFFVLN